MVVIAVIAAVVHCESAVALWNAMKRLGGEFGVSRMS